MERDDAIKAGFTREIFCWHGGAELHLLVRPGDNLDGVFTGWCLDEGEYLRVRGWMAEIEDVRRAA